MPQIGLLHWTIEGPGGKPGGFTPATNDLEGGSMRRYAVIALTALLSAACAGGGAASGGSKGPIQIGIDTSLTGNYALLGKDDKAAADLMVKMINGKGGINGRTVHMTVLDDGTSPTQSVVNYQKLVSQGVLAVEGPPQSTASMALIPEVDKAKVPDISVAAADAQVIPPHPYVFMTPPITFQGAAVTLSWMRQRGFDRLAVLYDGGSDFAVATFNALKRSAPKFGVQLVDIETFEAGSTNFTPQITRIKSSGAQLTIAAGSGSPMVILTKQYKDQGATIPLLVPTGASAQFIKPAEPEAENTFVNATMCVAGSKIPASNPFKKLIDGFAGPFEQTYGYYPSQFACDSAVAMTIMFAAIQKAGSDVTPQAVQQALQHLSVATPEGQYTYTPDRHYGMPDSAYLMGQVKNGQVAPFTQGVDLAKAGTGPVSAPPAG
jgi:branched-chain amino acid transport system substrate-binding protein